MPRTFFIETLDGAGAEVSLTANREAVLEAYEELVLDGEISWLDMTDRLRLRLKTQMLANKNFSDALYEVGEAIAECRRLRGHPHDASWTFPRKVLECLLEAWAEVEEKGWD